MMGFTPTCTRFGSSANGKVVKDPPRSSPTLRDKYRETTALSLKGVSLIEPLLRPGTLLLLIKICNSPTSNLVYRNGQKLLSAIAAKFHWCKSFPSHFGWFVFHHYYCALPLMIFTPRTVIYPPPPILSSLPLLRLRGLRVEGWPVGRPPYPYHSLLL